MQCPNCGYEMPVRKKTGDVQQDKVYSMLQWLGTLLLMFIPVVNVILLIYWSLSSKVNRNKRNWAVASLIFLVIAIILMIILYHVASYVLMSMIDRMFAE